MKDIKVNITILTLSLSIFLLARPQFCQAGAWTQEKRASYHYLSFTYYNTNSQFSETGRITPFSNGGIFRKRELNYYLEYGLNEDITLIGNFFYDWIEYRDDLWERTNQGLSSVELALRCKLVEKNYVLSFHSLLSIPPRAEEDPLLPITDGQIALELRLLLGKYFPNSKVYVNLELGARKHYREPHEELRYQVLAGSKKWSPWEFALQYDGIINLTSSESTELPQYDAISPDDYDLHRLTATIIYHLNEKRGLALKYYQHIAGRNTGEGWGISGGIIYEHKR